MISSFSSGFNSNIIDLDIKAPFTSKYGFSGVVDGKEVVMQVKPGDKVIYSKYSGTEVKLDEDENLIIVKQSDILAIIE